MPAPDFQSLFAPLLRAASDGRESPLSELRARVAGELRLTPEELARKLPSGVQTTFANRMAWAAIYLSKAGALQLHPPLWPKRSSGRGNSQTIVAP